MHLYPISTPSNNSSAPSVVSTLALLAQGVIQRYLPSHVNPTPRVVENDQLPSQGISHEMAGLLALDETHAKTQSRSKRESSASDYRRKETTEPDYDANQGGRAFDKPSSIPRTNALPSDPVPRHAYYQRALNKAPQKPEQSDTVTDYYGRPVNPPPGAYGFNSETHPSGRGRKQFLGYDMTGKPIYRADSRYLVGWDEQRKPIYSDDVRPQPSIDPSLIGNIPSTPAYGKGFEFADTNWWDYTTTTRQPRKKAPAKKPSHLNQYDADGNILPSKATRREGKNQYIDGGTGTVLASSEPMLHNFIHDPAPSDSPKKQHRFFI
ncbi:hypothetical protein GT347_04255 [Xylophilus rhododendri]|uniref:Uncharacterized protein n=1 Tax=Xylophilus rhododendri TaxID=2697032 RepID=A0A857J073_9BURK|nr:hypothetical protein [Xylophilus rhododendri]QHI97260.1 hypothetical protein GT347_04255 [Xylophilus rhododendri]